MHTQAGPSINSYSDVIGTSLAQNTSNKRRAVTIHPAARLVGEPKKTKTRSSADADNRLDAFSGQSRSTNMVPFHMLHIVSYCAIVTLS